MDKFDDMLQKEPSLDYIYRLAKESSRMLSATLAGDVKTMEEILTKAHNTEVPLLQYNSEESLSAMINLIYLSARDRYHVKREEKSGIGYVDYIFYPIINKEDAIILELKVDHTPEEAIAQIKEKQYILNLEGKLGETSECTGRILAVGIAYDKKSKKHHCKVEVLKEK